MRGVSRFARVALEERDGQRPGPARAVCVIACGGGASPAGLTGLARALLTRRPLVMQDSIGAPSSFPTNNQQSTPHLALSHRHTTTPLPSLTHPFNSLPPSSRHNVSLGFTSTSLAWCTSRLAPHSLTQLFTPAGLALSPTGTLRPSSDRARAVLPSPRTVRPSTPPGGAERRSRPTSAVSSLSSAAGPVPSGPRAGSRVGLRGWDGGEGERGQVGDG